VLDGSQFNDHGWSYIYTVKNMVTWNCIYIYIHTQLLYFL